MTLKEQVTFDRERVTSRSWDEYPVMKFSESAVGGCDIDQPV